MRLGLLLIMILSSVSMSRALSPETESLLQRLDETINNRSRYESERQTAAESKRMVWEAAGDDRARFDALKDLYGVYEGFQLDSAQNIAYRMLSLSEKMNDPERKNESLIILALSRTNSGNSADGIRILDRIDRTGLSRPLRERLYSAYFTANNQMERTEIIESVRKEASLRASEYMDSLISYLPSGSIGHTYLSAVRLDNKGMTRKAIDMLESASRNPGFSDNAAFQFGLGTMLLKVGRRDEAIDAIARASELDISAGKKEYMSMIRLAALLCEEGDIPRAFNYIRCALDDVRYSHAEIRTPEMMEVMPIIDSAYRAYEEAELKSATRNTLFAVAFGIAMCICLFVLWLQFKRISAIRHKLDLSNRELSERNAELARADALKLKHIDDLLYLQAANISNVKSYRKTLHRMMTAGQYSMVADRLRSDKPASEEVKAFYEKFDETFLSIFPDFIDEVNSYMKNPVQNDNSGILSPELRIIALMKLGIISTSRIAEMLQYSPRTVYNYRSSIRNSLNCPLEEFEQRISGQTDSGDAV